MPCLLTSCWSHFVFSSCILWTCEPCQWDQSWIKSGLSLKNALQRQPQTLIVCFCLSKICEFLLELIYKVLSFLNSAIPVSVGAGPLWTVSAASSACFHVQFKSEPLNSPGWISSAPCPLQCQCSVFRCLVTSRKNNLRSRQGAWQVEPLKAV